MASTVDGLLAELSTPRFRWWRRARLIGLIPTAVFLVGAGVWLLQGGNMWVMQHPLPLLTFGMWFGFLGMLLVCQPRTYAEYLRLHRVLRLAEKGHVPDENHLREYPAFGSIGTIFGGLFTLLFGLVLLVGGIVGL